MNISCTYCDKPLTHSRQAVPVCSGERFYLFCTIGCRDLYGFRKLIHRICAREDCTNRVPEGNRMLCSNCHQRGNHLAESETYFDEAERAHREKMERKLHKLIAGRMRIYNSQEMSGEKLRTPVPSLQEEAA